MELSLRNIRNECETNTELYGRTISDRTWQKWEKLVMKDKPTIKYRRQDSKIDKKTAILFFALARYRRLNPKKEIKWKQLCDYSLTTELTLSRERKYTISGKDLPAIIYSRFNVAIGERTLYRWAKYHNIPFSRHSPIEETDLSTWLSLVKTKFSIN